MKTYGVYPSVTDFLLERKGKVNFGGTVITQFYSWFDDRNNRAAFDVLKIIIPDILRDEEAKGKLYLEEHINYMNRFRALWSLTEEERSYNYYLQYARDLSTSVVSSLDKLTPEWLLTQYRDFMSRYEHHTVDDRELLTVTDSMVEKLCDTMPSYPVKDDILMCRIAIEYFK